MAATVVVLWEAYARWRRTPGPVSRFVVWGSGAVSQSMERLVEFLGVVVVLVLVFVLSVWWGPGLGTWLKSSMGYGGTYSEGLVFGFLAAVFTAWGLWNTLKILDEVTSEVHGFDDLMESVCAELEAVANCPRVVASVTKPYFCMYTKTPALGHISLPDPSAKDSAYQRFRECLGQALVRSDVSVRIALTRRPSRNSTRA